MKVMELKEKINSDFLTAYKNKEMDKKNFLGVIKGAIQAQEGRMIPSTDENVIKILKSMEKGLVEMIDIKSKTNSILEKETFELGVLRTYLPKLMNENDINLILDEILSRPNINKNIGFLMGLFNKEQIGKFFDNKMVSELIKKRI